MKQHCHNYKRRHIHNGHEFYSEKHHGDNYYSLIPRGDGFYELFKNGEHEPHILVRCGKDRLIAIGRGIRKGYSDTIDLDSVQFLDLNFVDESNFVEENENFTASFDGKEVLLWDGGFTKPDRFHLEHSLG